MNSETVHKAEWYLQAVAYVVKGIAVAIHDVALNISPSDYVNLFVLIIITGIFLYFAFKLLRFALRFIWIPVIVIAWEVARRHML